MTCQDPLNTQSVSIAPTFNCEQARAAAAGLKQVSRDLKLDGITTKELVNEGRP